MTVRLIPDQAIGELGNAGVDALDFEAYANVLAQAATDTPGPFTIGVLAEWGMGKTSLLHLTHQKLDSNDKIITVWFNAWRYEREEHPIIPLAATIVQELRQQTRSKKVDGWGDKLVKALQAIASGFSGRAMVKVPGLGELGAAFVAKDVAGRRRRMSPDELLTESLYHGAFSALDALQLPPDVRLVVFIDDLDRCFPNNAIRLLESIKLVLSQRGFIFILGVAREVLERYLEHRYSSDYGVTGTHARTYLDKIIQLPFPIPSPAARIDSLCHALLQDQPPPIQQALASVLPTVARALGSNPRATIRFVNNILIDAAVGTALGAEPPTTYFAITRALQHIDADTFDLLRDDDVAKEVYSWDRASIKEQALADGRAAFIAEAMVANADLEDLLFGSAGRDWLRNAPLRRASVDFLIKQSRLSHSDTADGSTRYDAFISYSPAMRPQAIGVIDGLSRDGLRVLNLEEAEAGESWEEGKPRTAPVMCVCVGPQSYEVEKDRYEAIPPRRDMRAISIIMPGASASDVPTGFRRNKRVDMSAGITEETIQRLALAIRIARAG